MSLDDLQRERVLRDDLTMRCAVYTGPYWDQPVRTDLPCNFIPASRARVGALTSTDRAENAPVGRLDWAPEYIMPPGARIEVDAYPGIFWNVQRGTVLPSLGPEGSRLFWTAELTRILS